MNIYAHRGIFDNENIVENTIRAFREALKISVNIELDVRVTKDKEIVVFHDKDLKRLTGIDKDVKDLTYDELTKITLLNTRDTIPKFEDVLKLVDGKVKILIEFKEFFSREILKKIDGLLLDYSGEVLLQSFNPFFIKKIASTSLKRYEQGILLTNKYKGLRKCFYDVYIYKYILKKRSYDFIACPKELVFDVRKVTDKKIFIWTIKTKDEFVKYKKYSNNLICEKKGIII